MFFVWQGVDVMDHIPLDTSAEECYLMKIRKECGERKMSFSDGKWSFTQEPEAAWSWLRTIESEKTNCLMEQTAFFFHTNEQTVETPLGLTNVSSGSISHNHITAIWDTTLTKQNPERKILIEKGEAEFTKITKSTKQSTT